MYNNEFHSSGNFESGGPSNQPIETNDYHVHEDPWQPSSSWFWSYPKPMTHSPVGICHRSRKAFSRWPTS